MSKVILILFIIVSAIPFLACNNTGNTNNTAKNAANSVKAEIKSGVVPVADNEIAVVEMAEPAFGTMKIELYSNIAPKMVERFKTLAKEGVYNGTTFHRVSGMVIQGGDPNTKDNDPSNDGRGGSDKPNVPAEFSDVPFERGIVGAARMTDVNTANSQFYITMQRNPGWDKNYTVFGKVFEGLNNASTISGVPKEGERPLDKVVIKSITIQPKN
ncbi:MAG: peptidylprolyl isomerase [Acidobacteria bacterium]|jgi:cyclophilin family peptidyl-prolyl cis-trans isomerase|nr:peptidylprolyl isomerase [Acidobacteriota bacterium]